MKTHLDVRNKIAQDRICIGSSGMGMEMEMEMGMGLRLSSHTSSLPLMPS